MAGSENTTPLPIDRRALLMGASSLAFAGAMLPTSEAAPLAPLPDLLERYNAWLHMERRLLAREMYPELGSAAERFIPDDPVATAFHFPANRPYTAMPPPSSRAAVVLRAAGVFTGPGDEGASDTSGAPEWEHPDAALLAAWAGYVRTCRAFDKAVEGMPGGGTDEDHAPFRQEIEAYRDQIEKFPARTVEGFAVQLRHLFAEKMECSASFNAAIYGEPLTAKLAEEIDGDWRDRMLWRMVQAATRASRVNTLTETAW